MKVFALALVLCVASRASAATTCTLVVDAVTGASLLAPAIGAMSA